jgi:sodium/potassium-transporting ATPase subunit alpha
MAVTEYCIGSANVSVSESALQQDAASPAATQLRAIAALCNAAEFDAADMDTPVHRRRAHGDATDQAILRFSEQLGSVREMHQGWKRTFELAFRSKNKFMIRTFEMGQDEAAQSILVGAKQPATEGDT